MVLFNESLTEFGKPQSGCMEAPGGEFLVRQYRRFRRRLPLLCDTDRNMVKAWLKDA